jgi:hypothetical protein
LSRLKAVGKYHGDTVRIIGNLAGVLNDQARYPEVEKLVRTCLEIYEVLGYPPDSAPLVGANYRLGVALFAQRRYADAKVQFERVDAATQSWPAQRSVGYRTSWSRVVIDYNTRNVEAGIERAREQLAAQKLRKGDAHYDTAMARAVLATGLTYARRDAEALAEFKLSMPTLLNATHDDEEGDLTARLSAEGRLQAVAEANMVLIARAQDPQSAATESFKIGEAIRGRSVQNALEASAARSAAKTAALAELVRKEQDLAKQTAALAGSINAVQDLSPEERDDNALKALQAELDTVRNDRRTAKREIERRFPEYNNLINQAVTVADVQAALSADEALVSFISAAASFVWAIRKAARSSPMRRTCRTSKRVKIAQVTRSDASPVRFMFDLKALRLSSCCSAIRPVCRRTSSSRQWRARLLPLGLLPVRPTAVTATRAHFSDYRKWPGWRRPRVTMVPSASTLRTLRQVAKVSSKRDSMIGFGDPYFNADQEKEVTAEAAVRVAEVTTRGLPIRLRAVPRTADIDGAEIAQLPRLPDTADELKSIAIALEADPAKVLHLGKSANEDGGLDLALSHCRVRDAWLVQASSAATQPA